MRELHEAHLGIAQIKSLACQYIWWLRIDSDLEHKVKTCKARQSTRKNPAPASLHPWEWPRRPWLRVYADYAGPYVGHMFLVLVDAHTKWMDTHIVSSATSQSTIEKMQNTFAICWNCWRCWSRTTVLFSWVASSLISSSETAFAKLLCLHTIHHPMGWWSVQFRQWRMDWGIGQWLGRDKAISVPFDWLNRQSQEFRQPKWCLVDLFVRSWICCNQTFKHSSKGARSSRAAVISSWLLCPESWI